MRRKKKEVPEVIPRTPEPHIKSTPEAPLTLLKPTFNQEFKSSLRELETAVMELIPLVLEQCFIKQSANINSECLLRAPSGDNNPELGKTLLFQIECLKKELTYKNAIIHVY